MNKCYVFELFKKNAARKEFCWEFMVKNYEIFFMKIQQKTRSSLNFKAQSSPFAVMKNV